MATLAPADIHRAQHGSEAGVFRFPCRQLVNSWLCLLGNRRKSTFDSDDTNNKPDGEEKTITKLRGHLKILLVLFLTLAPGASFAVISAPIIGVSPASFSATLAPDEALIVIIDMTNSGGSDLEFSVTESADACTSSTDIGWLEITPVSGVIPPGGTVDASATIDATGQAARNYTASICITSNDPARPLVSVAVSLTVEIPIIEVPVDIRPGSCPNPLNCKVKGVLPVAIPGTAGLDVAQIDPLSIRLAGVEPLRSDIEDVTTPFAPYTGKQDCDIDCNTVSPDGFQDLTLKFDLQHLIAALGDSVQNGACVIVKLTGNLRESFGGTDIVGEDVMRIGCKTK